MCLKVRSAFRGQRSDEKWGREWEERRGGLGERNIHLIKNSFSATFSGLPPASIFAKRIPSSCGANSCTSTCVNLMCALGGQHK